MTTMTLDDTTAFESLSTASGTSGSLGATTLTLIGDTLRLAAALLGASPLRPGAIARPDGHDAEGMRARFVGLGAADAVADEMETSRHRLAGTRLGMRDSNALSACQDDTDFQDATWEDAAFY
jgi:hypothetical protein